LISSLNKTYSFFLLDDSPLISLSHSDLLYVSYSKYHFKYNIVSIKSYILLSKWLTPLTSELNSWWICILVSWIDWRILIYKSMNLIDISNYKLMAQNSKIFIQY
jgi:hypothetical protein